MPSVDVIAGYSFLLIGSLVILSNYYYFVSALLGQTSTSFTLIIGGVFSSLGILISPAPWYFFPLPLMLDFTIPWLLLLMLRAK